MSWFFKGYIIAPFLAGLWMITIVISFSVIITFCTGDSYKPEVIQSFLIGVFSGSILIYLGNNVRSWIIVILLVIILALNGYASITLITEIEKNAGYLLVNLVAILLLLFALTKTPIMKAITN